MMGLLVYQYRTARRRNFEIVARFALGSGLSATSQAGYHASCGHRQDTIFTAGRTSLLPIVRTTPLTFSPMRCEWRTRASRTEIPEDCQFRVLVPVHRHMQG